MGSFFLGGFVGRVGRVSCRAAFCDAGGGVSQVVRSWMSSEVKVRCNPGGGRGDGEFPFG